MSPTSHLSPTTKRVLRRAQLFMTAVDVVIFGLSCASALLFVLGLSNAGYYGE
jgi:hypothetical protein